MMLPDITKQNDLTLVQSWEIAGEVAKKSRIARSEDEEHPTSVVFMAEFRE
jgi:hypothetical protein